MMKAPFHGFTPKAAAVLMKKASEGNL